MSVVACSCITCQWTRSTHFYVLYNLHIKCLHMIFDHLHLTREQFVFENAHLHITTSRVLCVVLSTHVPHSAFILAHTVWSFWVSGNTNHHIHALCIRYISYESLDVAAHGVIFLSKGVTSTPTLEPLTRQSKRPKKMYRSHDVDLFELIPIPTAYYTTSRKGVCT